MQVLVLFDIDATLLWTGGAGRAALRLALAQVYGTVGTFDTFDPGGRTIREIVDGALSAAGIEPETVARHYARFDRVMVAEFERLLKTPAYTVEPCPGAPALVRALAAEPGILLGLLTGNPRSTAQIKLRAAGYDPATFRVGAYGDESPDRVELLRLAIQRASQLSGTAFDAAQVVVVGDTQKDIVCGQALGARTIAVATGSDPYETLARQQPTAIFHDFTRHHAVIKSIVASSPSSH